MCDPQCWYDIFVYSPKGDPDIVYAGGDYSYGEVIANKRGVVLSTDAGVTGTDMTFDGTDPLHPNGLHPDQHDIITVPGKPLHFIETNDGGVMRSNGRFVDRSSWCTDPAVPRGLSGAALARCQQMLSRIPERLEGINDGLNTLQFQSLSISPHDNRIRQGGTQDNGTWETNGNRVTWENMMIGDGGQSGFDVAIPEFRFHTFTTASGGRELQQREHRRLDLDRRPDRPRRRVLLADHQRSGGEQVDVRGHGPDGVPDADGRARDEDRRRGEHAVQRVDRNRRGPVR